MDQTVNFPYQSMDQKGLVETGYQQSSRARHAKLKAHHNCSDVSWESIPISDGKLPEN